MASARTVEKAKLVAVLKECTAHLEKTDDYSPIFHEALAALNVHLGRQMAILQQQVATLKGERDTILQKAKIQQQQLQQQQAAAKAPAQNQAQQQQQVASDETQKLHQQRVAEFERQKKAAAEKRRQEVIEQRRKAAEEQKKRQQEEKRKFLEYEQRKQNLKQQAAKAETAATSKKPLQHKDSLVDKMNNEMSAAFVKPKQASSAAESPMSPQQGTNKQTPQPTTTSPQYKSPTVSQKSAPSGAPTPTSTPAAAAAHPIPSQTPQPKQAFSSSATSPNPTPRNSNTPGHQPQQQTPRGTPGFPQPQQVPSQTPLKKPSTTPTPTTPSMNIPHLPKQAPQQRPQPPQPQPQQQPQARPHEPTGSDKKYSNMSQQQANNNEASPSSTTLDDPTAMSALKRNILIHWALQPPSYQTLRPIQVLLKTIQNVFPPAFGVGSHDYFEGWQPITGFADANDGVVSGQDAQVIKKAVRKLRFFLHPDKLPRDLTSSQSFACKLLWDVTNDAFEDYKTALESLDWMNN